MQKPNIPATMKKNLQFSTKTTNVIDMNELHMYVMAMCGSNAERTFRNSEEDDNFTESTHHRGYCANCRQLFLLFAHVPKHMQFA